jgi:hypothetical protein
MVGDGSWGTLARSHSGSDVISALGEEMKRWNDGERDPVAISAYWHDRLRPEAVARTYRALIEELPARTGEATT